MRNQLDTVERLNLVLGALRDVNRLLVREKDPDVLLGGICKALMIFTAIGGSLSFLLNGFTVRF